VQQLQQTARQKLQALGTEKETVAQKLAGVQDQAQAAAAAKAKLSRELGTTKETLEAARARSAELNKSYEKLLKDHSKLSATDAARQEELARTRIAFEEAQNEVARLTGARGIYTVQSADSLSSIAAYFYRNGNRWSDIHKANDFLAKNPDLVYAGQVLIIPN
jgi:nucleoid-associated protein YgaU